MIHCHEFANLQEEEEIYRLRDIENRINAMVQTLQRIESRLNKNQKEHDTMVSKLVDSES
jgi:hypothetical protein